MFFYIGIALFILLGSFTKQSKIIYRLSLVLLFFVTAFKDLRMGGDDAIIYEDFFETIPKLTELAGYDSKYTLGYTLLNSFVKTFSSEFVVYQVIYTLICITLIHLILKQLEITYKEKCLFLFSYFCFRFIWNTWVLLRQNLAVLIFWLLFIVLYKKVNALKLEGKKIWQKEVVLLTAMTIIVPPLFHSSAWVNVALVPLIFLFGKIDYSKKLLTVPIISVGIYFLGRGIFSYLLEFAVTFIDSRYGMYLSRADMGESNFINFLLRLCFFIFFAVFYTREKYPYKKMVLDLMVFMVLIGSVNAELMTRLYEYYAIGLYICMALVLRHFSGKGKLIALGIYGLAMIIILCRFIGTTGGGLFINYEFCF